MSVMKTGPPLSDRSDGRSFASHNSHSEARRNPDVSDAKGAPSALSGLCADSVVSNIVICTPFSNVSSFEFGAPASAWTSNFSSFVTCVNEALDVPPCLYAHVRDVQDRPACEFTRKSTTTAWGPCDFVSNNCMPSTA